MSASLNNDLQDQLVKYQAEHISREEFRELIQVVNNNTDEELYPILLDCWNIWENAEEMSSKEARELLLRIRQKANIGVVGERKKTDWRRLVAIIAILIMGGLSVYLYMDNQSMPSWQIGTWK